MTGKVKFKQITDFVLKLSSADETEVVLIGSEFALTRFANNQVHQNLIRENTSLSIRVVLGKKIGVVKTNKIDRISLEKAIDQAIAMAGNQKEDQAFVSLPQPCKYKKIEAFCDSTASFSPRQRAEKIKSVIKQAKGSNLNAFGALSNGVTEYVVANSHGLFAYFPQTEAGFSTVIMADSSSGYGSDLNLDVLKLNIESEARKAIQVALKSRKPKPVKPKEYEVVLSPVAVNEMLIYLSYLGFGARAYHEDRSFLSGKLGQKVMGENISIWDDGLDRRGIPMPFDLEGSARKKVILIEKGVAKNVVYDSYLAGKYKAQSTGHGFPAPNTLDALATHLHLKPASLISPTQADTSGVHIGRHPGEIDEAEQELISKVKKGLYLSRFWYVNAHHHKTLEITGLTRDGTFMIENGEITYPVVNLRFTQSIPKAFNQVAGIGRETKAVESWLGANLVPALRIKKFNFTGVSRL